MTKKKIYNFEIPANQTIVKLHTFDGGGYEKRVIEADAIKLFDEELKK